MSVPPSVPEPTDDSQPARSPAPAGDPALVGAATPAEQPLSAHETASAGKAAAFGEESARVAGQRRRLDRLLPPGRPPAPRGKVIAVMPAYNAAATLERTVADIPAGSVDEIVVVDDCSRDNTVEIARALGLTVIAHERNLGYGGNQKTCYARALESGADYVVMIHPDYQYDSRVIPAAIDILRLGICDVMLGSRIRTRREALEGGMPIWKYLANRCLTFAENIALGQNLGDFHSGFRAYSRQVLETVPWQSNSDDFVFDSQFLAQAVQFGFKLGDIPVPVRYFDEASSINFRRSVTYGCSTLWVLAQFWLHKLRLVQYDIFRPRPVTTAPPG